jgi:serine/threonine-protein kinase HipA
MTTSEPQRAYVWVWLPTATDPVVAGVLEARADTVFFNYGRSYLERPGAIPLYSELPLQPGRQRPAAGLRAPGCISDAAPDAWGQRVILHRLLGRSGRDTDPAELGLLTYLLESGSDRVGALDFQTRADIYEPRDVSGTLEEMLTAAERLEAGEVFSAALDDVLLRGSSIGGARPKVLLDDGPRKLIAKFSSRTDTYPVVKAEGAAMHLARLTGVDAARVEVTECLGHDVLLVERFDRTSVPGERRLLVSTLTILGLDEMMGRYATYHELADVIRARFTNPKATLRELFRRIVFNICVGNTDDHARNHAAFWDGAQLTLTPAYDLCPQPRAGGEAAQAMAIGRDGARLSRLATCLAAAPVYLLDAGDARELIDEIVDAVRKHWAEAADAARLTAAERAQLEGRQILNPYVFESYGSGTE